MEKDQEASGLGGTANIQEELPEPEYTIFNHRQRTLISWACSISATFSTISSFIYYPAISPLAKDLNVSVQAINFSVTSYLIVAGLAPSIFGDMADRMGRRPVIVATFTLYVASNIGLASLNNYAALIALRALQSTGASSSVAIAYAVIADITTPENRGGYVGVMQGFTNAAPSLGPVIGGIVAQELSWRWIFWLLAIFSGTHFACLLTFLPETSRNLVGNGNVLPPRLNRSLLQISRRAGKSNPDQLKAPLSSRIVIPNPLMCLVALFNGPNFIVIIVGGLQYTVQGCLAASLSVQMIDIYELNYLTAGLVYLPAGLGGIIAAFGGGRLLDYDYQKVKQGLGHSMTKDDESFPIEKARLRSVFPMIAISSIATCAYGWTLEARTSLAAPLVVQFFCGASQVFVFVICGTLLTDFNQGRTATAQASYNLIRCTLGAAGVAALQAMIKGIGVGWCFTTFAFFGALGMPLFIILRIYGPQWRHSQAPASESRNEQHQGAVASTILSDEKGKHS